MTNFTLLAGSLALASPALATDLKTIFQKPLIVGASVSGDHFTDSPGKKLALRYTTKDEIKVVAQKGKPGRDVLKNLGDQSFRDRTVVVGMDLFFWDSFQANPSESLKSLDRLMKIVTSKNIPIVLGDIPVLMPSRQPSVAALNQRILQACKAYPQCYLLPMQSLLMKTITDGFIIQNGTKYTLEALLPDGLHIAAPASEFLADRIHDLFLKKPF